MTDTVKIKGFGGGVIAVDESECWITAALDAHTSRALFRRSAKEIDALITDGALGMYERYVRHVLTHGAITRKVQGTELYGRLIDGAVVEWAWGNPAFGKPRRMLSDRTVLSMLHCKVKHMHRVGQIVGTATYDRNVQTVSVSAKDAMEVLERSGVGLLVRMMGRLFSR